MTGSPSSETSVLATNDDRDTQVVWETFRCGPVTLPETPGARDAWHLGRPRYHVWVFRLTDPALRARVAELQALLTATAPAAFVPTALEDLHLTVFVAGFATTAPRHDDCVAWDVLDAQTGALRSAGRRTRLRVGGASSFLTVPFLWLADPHRDLAALRACLGTAAREIRFAPYRPHLTLGRYTAALPTAPLAQALAPARALPWLDVTADTLELVSFDAATPGATLVTERRLALK